LWEPWSARAASQLKNASISDASCALRWNSAAPTIPLTWPGRRAPTMAPVTARLFSTQATDTRGSARADGR
jgi:hypothetical protein